MMATGSINRGVLQRAIRTVIASNEAVGRKDQSLTILLEKTSDHENTGDEIIAALKACISDDTRVPVKLKSTMREKAQKKLHIIKNRKAR